MKFPKQWLKRRIVGRVMAMATVVGALVVALCWWALPPLDPSPFLRYQASGQLVDREGKALYISLNADESWSLPQSSDGFSAYLVQATLAAEDQRFYQHPGVDPIAVVRAAWQNAREGGVASGASTLSMQLVKLGGQDSASFSGKIGQAVGALRLEKSLSKDAILSAYLNHAPYGMNLLGAEAASWRYFGKRAATLSLTEAALLAGLPKAPSRLNPLAHPDRARQRRDYVLNRMWTDGFIDAAQRDRALATPVSVSWHDFPRLAPHLGADYGAELRQGEKIALTLDASLQQKLEGYLPHYLKRFDGAISNGAVMVVEVSTGEVLARVASAGFQGVPGGGQVDSCRALRSPGSTLKPLLYGFAMARQQLYPGEVLLDDVLDYGRYAPGNFDGLFNGPVTATEGLRYSLNVPAVALLARVGVRPFHGFLRDGGLTSIDRVPEDYGLGLALGNCEVSLEALSRLYLSVASLGEQNALRMVQDGAVSETAGAVFTADVSRLLYTMLAQPFPDELDGGLLRRRGNEAPVCWKTGTSTGYNDAWTFAFNRHYLVAVWLGNNDGHGAQQLVGARAALPLAARIFRDLPKLAGDSWPGSPAGNVVSMCAASGLPASAGCPDRVDLELPPSFWQHRRCTLHQVSQTGAMVVAARPASASAWDLATVSSMARPSAEGLESLAPLRITSPPQGATFVLSGVAGGDQISLAASGGAEEGAHWFIDGRYLGVSEFGEALDWSLRLGEHTVAVQLTDGRRDTATFSVVRPGAGEKAPE